MYGMDEISELSITSLIWKPTECQNLSALSGVVLWRVDLNLGEKLNTMETGLNC